MENAQSPPEARRELFPLLASVFVVATCGLIYELVSGTLASYLLGDSVFQFSTVIGTYLFAMGVGSYLSRFVENDCARAFVRIELLVGAVGGFSSTLLFLLFDHVDSFPLVLYFLVFLIGALVGMEIPLMMRILQGRLEFKDLVARIFAFDYVGALAASILFPLIFAPKLGLMRTSILFGILNVGVALWTLRVFEAEIARPWKLRWTGALLLLALVLGFAASDRLVSFAEAAVYPHPILYTKSSPYQRIVVTRLHDEYRLYLNSHLQFSSRDEYRYHEALVHPGLSFLKDARKVLVLGGGDGLAVREILKYPSVERVELVDLDPSVTELFENWEPLRHLNGNAFASDRVEVIHQDAFQWLKRRKEVSDFDFVVVDFPDPTNFSIGKLYSTTFFKELRRTLRPDGVVVIQSTSPLFARNSYWCIDATLKASGLETRPYHAYVPSFGEWGYTLAALPGTLPFRPLPRRSLPSGLKFLGDSATFSGLYEFPADMSPVPSEPNRLNNQILVGLYEREWSKVIQ